MSRTWITIGVPPIAWFRLSTRAQSNRISAGFSVRIVSTSTSSEFTKEVRRSGSCVSVCDPSEAPRLPERKPAVRHLADDVAGPGTWHRVRISRRVSSGKRPHLSGRPLLAAVVCLSFGLTARSAHADPMGWSQPGGPGTPVVITYSFVNVFSPNYLGMSEFQLRTTTADAFGIWASYAPLYFVERPDTGPPPAEVEYTPDGHPEIRIGVHPVGDPQVLAHAFLPVVTDVSGLAGDIHLNSDSAQTWASADGPSIDFLELMMHEIGHALGLHHVDAADAIMNPTHGFRFGETRQPFLLPADIAAVQAIYGSGAGSVAPIPEPSTFVLVAAGVVAMFTRRRATVGRRRTPIV
jgi:Matrixin/PEP-CTERM motif